MLDKNVTEMNEAARKNIGRAIMEYEKVGRQRAATGARLRVIRQLTGMKPSFDEKEILNPMLFTRIVQNTSYILQTPEGRAMATAQALGLDVAALFGGRKAALTAGDAAPETGAEETGGGAVHAVWEYAEGTAPAAPPAPPSGGDGPPPQGAAPPDFEAPEFDRLTAAIRDYLEGYRAELDVTLNSGTNPYKSAGAELQNHGATVETRRDMTSRLRNFLLQKGRKV
jgi:hypothetical protein